MSSLSELPAQLKTGQEFLTYGNQNLKLKLIDFWRWSVSDIVSNATRGRFAEFIVAAALESDFAAVRDEWSAYDLIYADKIKIEVKSAAFLQSWSQKDFSKISFSIRPTKHWDRLTNKQAEFAARQADIYVFCLLKHKDKSTLNPLNLDQWEFYVLSTEALNNYKRSKVCITLNSLQKLTAPVSHEILKDTILKQFIQN